MSIELVIAEKLGGLKCIVNDDMKSCEVEGIGRAEVSYCSMRPHDVIINNIEINPYNNEAVVNFIKIAESKGIKVKCKKRQNGTIDPGRCGFSLSDEQKRTISDRINSVYDSFVSDILSGKIRIYVSIVGCDWPHAVLGIKEREYQGLKAWDLFFHWADEKNKIYEAHRWISREKQKDNTDVTEDVFEELKKRAIKAEESKKKTDEKRKIESEKLKQAFEDELWVFGDEILSSAGGRLLHSIGAIISKNKNKIEIFTCGYTRFMKEIPHHTTFDIQDKLKEKGYSWNTKDKTWEIMYSEENITKTVDILKKYDTKTDPVAQGLCRCWECGSWNYESELDEDGYCGC